MWEVKDAAKRYASLETGNSLLARIKANKRLMNELASLGIPEEEIKRYLPILSNYLDSTECCNRCPGLENCPSDHPGYAYALRKDGDQLVLEYGVCRMALNRQRLEAAYSYRDFPDEWLTAPKPVNSKKNKEILLALNKAVKEGEKPWAYLYGLPGAGKSFLCAVISNALALKGARVDFLNANKRFDELKTLAIESKKKFAERMERLQNADLLIIDEFGSEFHSDYVRDQIVLPILNERSKKHLPTFFCSDYSLEDIEKLYCFNKNPSTEMLAKQLVRLIRANIAAPKEVEVGFEN